MAVGLDTGVPWVMCKEDDAPDPVVICLVLSHSWIFHCFADEFILNADKYV